jgi:hypothetical protein
MRGKVVGTTNSHRMAPRPLDKVNRQFGAGQRDWLRISDFTRPVRNDTRRAAHCGAYAIARTTPPSTRRAAPVVADARALQT